MLKFFIGIIDRHIVTFFITIYIIFEIKKNKLTINDWDFLFIYFCIILFCYFYHLRVYVNKHTDIMHESRLMLDNSSGLGCIKTFFIISIVLPFKYNKDFLFKY